MILRPPEETVRSLVRNYIADATPGQEHAAAVAVAALPDETTALTVANVIQKACADWKYVANGAHDGPDWNV